MVHPAHRQKLLVIVACLLITLSMGSLHAFSTLIENIETQTEISRMASSLVYSTAIVNVTIAVFFGHIIYRRLSSLSIMGLIVILPIIGIFIVNTESWIGWITGYGIFFGLASGLGYGFSLYALSHITPKEKLGLALGSVTASYAFGALIFSLLYPILIDQFNFKAGYGIGVILISTLALVALILFLSSKIQLNANSAEKHEIQSSNSGFIRLWLGYYFGVFAGLLAMGHAVPIIKTLGGSMTIAITSITLMSLGSGFAGIYSGFLADRFGCKNPLILILITSAFSLAILTIFIDIKLTLFLIILVATLYGAIIAIYPTLVTKLFGIEKSAWAYGRIFTAWGFAGLTAPSIAGFFYDYSDNYSSSLLLAAILATLAAIIIWRLPSKV